MTTSHLENRNYVDEFLSLKCSGDVLNIVNPLGNKAKKEITEALSIMKRVRSLTLENPMKYNLVDFCAGNALVSVLAVFLLPITKAVAVDKRERSRKWHLARNFRYWVMDIYSDDVHNLIDENTIITGCHACGNLSHRINEIYLNSPAKALVMMPCCSGDLRKNHGQFLMEKLSRYELWSLELAEEVNGSLTQDKLCISPRNLIIKAVRR